MVQPRVECVDDVAAAFADLVVERAPTSVALSGGETAEECYAALAERSPDWSGVDVFMGDERFVPLTDPDSNEGMIRRVLLGAVPARTLHSMAGAGPDAEDAAAAYDALVAGAPPIDIAHLGLGPDGHTASLFPGAPQLDVTNRLVVTSGDGLHPHPRLTFTYPGIARCQLAVFTVTGADKREPLRRVLDGDRSLPAARVEAPEVLWLVDREALG